MNDSSQTSVESTAREVAENLPNGSQTNGTGRDKLLSRLNQIRVLERLHGAMRLRRVQRMGEELGTRAVNYLMGSRNQSNSGEEMGDDIRFDSPTYHYHQEHRRNGMGGLAKMLLGGTLVATGAGAALGIPMILDGLKDTTEAVQPPREHDGQEFIDTDTDTHFELRLSPSN